ncbi:MAG: RusA family crossover junction endodeoxyribonuclease [Chloroflexi bacterium]|nr:RusA family crossover junction endodeoxyribonuclease [Chloroflexota bacterium]
MEQVREAAKPKFSTPRDDQDLKIQVTFFYVNPRTLDVDNMLKLICDALKGIAYNDDSQLSDAHARRRDIQGSYRLEDVPVELVEALADGEEFVFIEVSTLGESVREL